jgi:hypothetical protein
MWGNETDRMAAVLVDGAVTRTPFIMIKTFLLVNLNFNDDFLVSWVASR